MLDYSQLARLTGVEINTDNYLFLVKVGRDVSYRAHRVRQLTEVALALLFTFGLMRVLKKPAGD